MKRIIQPLILFLILTILPVTASAHPGGTDSAGGHTDHSTGEYHYHHGYSAHQHTDMDGDGIKDCPYDIRDATTDRSYEDSSPNSSFYYVPPKIELEIPEYETLAAIPSSPTHPTNSDSDTSGFPFRSEPEEEHYLTQRKAWKWLFAILCGTLLILLIYNFQKSGEHRRTEQRLRREYNELKERSDRSSSLLKNTESKVALLEKRANDSEAKASLLEKQLKAEKESTQKQLSAKNELQAELKRLTEEIDRAKLQHLDVLKAQAVKDMSLDDLEKLTRRYKNAPVDVTFAKNGLPIRWKPDPHKPYGDYTVYVNTRSEIYHADRYCSSYNHREEHIFNVIDRYRPCKKCAVNAFPFSTVPDWYRKCK